MKYEKFEREMNSLLMDPASQLGFSHEVGPYFSRPRHSWKDVFFYDLDRASKDRFSVCVGIHVPAVVEELADLVDPKLPAPLSYRFLGQGEGQRWYRFKDASLAAAVETMMADFQREAEPWLRRFSDLRQICEAYYDQRVAAAGATKSDPIAWAVYGFLLALANHADEADRWLRRSLEEVSRPLYVVGGRVSSDPAPGAKEVSRPPQERVLRALLERRYGAHKPP